MQGFDKKKINFIIILIFGYFSISNLSKFNNYDVLKSLNDQDFIELSSELEGYDDLDAENDQKLKLTRKKKSDSTNRDFDDVEIAKYSDQDIASDYINDEANLNLSLIPIFETMLFSGIPNPKQKPIPESYDIFKSTAVTVKNKKSLKETLLKFLTKNDSQLVFDRVNEYIDYGVEENLKFLSDDNDKIIEINTFTKDYRQLNSRRNQNNDFVFYYKEAPTETKVVRKRMKVKNSLSSTLKSAGIPNEIVKNYLHH